MELHDEEFDNVNPGESIILIPSQGFYPAQFSRREIRQYGTWGTKLLFYWKVFVTPDMTTSVDLVRYYNAERDKAGRFKFGPLHGYRQDWVAANRGKVPLAREKLPPSIFQGQTFVVEVVTVTRNTRGPLSESFHWSKISRVIRPLEDDERVERCPL